jgi:ubiquinone/menaquinone biosynthesis C-methylase UbiE
MTEPNSEELRERARKLWALGDYPRIAAMIRPAARELADSCAISAGQEVLDVGAGTGNLALIAAEEGADVIATDIAPAQIELGRARLDAEGVDVEWVEADVEELPFDDDRFDCAASVFGAVFAPHPEVAAREMFRVVKPGGTIGLTSWGYFGSQGAIFEAINEFAPPRPAGTRDSRDWGNEENVQAWVGPLASSLSIERKAIHSEFESFEELWETLGSAGPGAAMRAALPAETVAKAEQAVRGVVERHNQAEGGRVALEQEYLEIVARKRG